MKILAIGDFHGKFSEKLKKEAKKADLILCAGDYANADKIRKIIFKNWVDKKWYEIVGLKKAGKLEKESFDSGLKILEKLNRLNKKVYFIFGNTDFYKDYMTSEPPIIMPGFYEDKIKRMKNLILVDKKKRKINNLKIIGYGGYLDATEYIKNPIDKDKKKQKRRAKRYKRSEEKLFELFKLEKQKNFIFLIHYPPYKIFDKVKSRNPMHGKNIGFEPYNKVIKKYKPFLVICGHMHEYQGKCKIGKSLVVNPGPAQEGKAAVIEVENNKVKNVKFLR